MRAKKHTPVILNSNNRLQIRINFQSKRYYLSLGLSDTAQNRKLAQSICLAMESDISLGTFDTTLKRYRDKTPNKSRECEDKPKVTTLTELWEKYTSFKSSQLEETTIEIKYKNVESWVNKLPSAKIEDAVLIRDWLLTQTSVSNTKYLLQQFGSCCRWAVKSGLCDRNPFEGMNADILDKHAKKDIDPFTREEMIAIVEAFKAQGNHYASFVEFLFLTGCRTSEAIGIQWKHINADKTFITFETAIVRHGGNFSIKSLKTQERREFPINSQLKLLLNTLTSDEVNPDDHLFKPTERSTVKHINHSAFLDKHWVPIVQGLVEEGKVKRYRTQYNTRHTFITLALQKGIDVATIAKWVGNSPKTIYQHYAGFNHSAIVPEF